MSTASRRLSTAGALGSAQFDALERIATGAPVASVLADLVKLVESQAPGMACSVLVLDEAGTTVAETVVQQLPETLGRELIGMTIGPNAGSCGAAAWSGHRVIVEDIEHHPNWAAYVERALPYGWLACWSNPIKSSTGVVLGTFAMYFQERRAPSPDEVRWVETATHLAAIALERARSLARLERREREFRGLFDAAAIGMALADPTGRLLHTNAVLQRMLGYSADELRGVDFTEFTHPDDREVGHGLFKALAAGTIESIQVEKRYLRKDGAVIWGRLTGSVVRSAEGVVEFSIGMIEDITRQRLDQERLERLTRFSAVSSHVNEAMVRVRDPQSLYERVCEIAVEHGGIHMAWVGIIDASGLIVPVARAGEAAAYLDAIRLSVKDDVVALGPAGRAAVLGQQAVSQDIAHDPTFVWREVAGTYGLRSCATFPLKVDGRPIGMFAVYADQPNVFNDDEVAVLAALAENLSFAVESARRENERQKAVEERKLAEAQLLRSQRLESIGTLAGGIAHDFNNILASIVGNAGLASVQLAGSEETGADPETVGSVLDSIDEIERAGVRASELVARILTFSRQQEPERSSVSLPTIVDETLDLLRATVPAMIEIRRDYDDNLPLILADATQLHQVLMNLCTNAAQAIGQQSGILSVTIRTEDVHPGQSGHPEALIPGPYMKLSVSDTGPGIDLAVLDRIFEPFFTTKEASQGTGLGLSVVHGIIRNHHGAIRVDSTPGVGTRFDVWLPMSSRVETSEIPVQTDAQRGQGERIMIVDDEASLVALHSRFFKRMGYRAIGLTSVAEALAHFERDPDCCDLLVTDSAMPGQTGLDLIRQVRKVRPYLPIVLMSGFFRAPDLEAAAELGVTMWQKPGRPGDLGQIAARLLYPESSAS